MKKFAFNKFSRNCNRKEIQNFTFLRDWKLLTILEAEQDNQTDKNSFIQRFRKIRRRNIDLDSKYHADTTKMFIVVLLYCFKKL